MPASGQLIGAASQKASQILGGLEGGFQLFNSLHKLKQDKEELAKLKTPFYKIQDEYYQNRNLANEQAQGGLPIATKDYYTDESQRGLGAGIGAIEATGGNPNDVSHLFDNYDKSIDRIASADAEAHLKNIDYFMNVNKDLAGQKTTQWGINEYKPYNDKLSEITSRRAADEKSAYNGVNSIIGALGAAGTSSQNQGMLNGITGKMGEPFQAPSGLTGRQTTPIDTINNRDAVNTPTTLADNTNSSNNNDQLYQQFQQWLASQNQPGKF